MSVRSRLRAWTPPALLAVGHRALGHGLRFDDVSGGWAQAIGQSSGYETDLIVQRVAAATREVVAGRALFERDSVVFHEPEFRYPIVAALMRSAALNAGCLEVVDFGGSLGSTYWQCQPFLTGLRRVRWCIVEQPHFAEVGRREFGTAELTFHAALSELPPPSVPRLVLLSSAIQYLQDPDAALDGLLALQPAHMVIDRTPMSPLSEHRLTVQHAPRRIYKASYPCWVLSRRKLLDRLPRCWRLVCEFACDEGSASTSDGLRFEFRGLFAECCV